MENIRNNAQFAPKSYPKKNSVRPTSADSWSTDSADSQMKMTRDQHMCIQNLGMASAFFLPVALIIGAVAIATNYWFNINSNYVGLFKSCNNWTTICTDVSVDYANSTIMETTWKIGVPLELGGIGFLTLAMLFMTCYPCHRKVKVSKIACGIVVGVVLLLGLFSFLGGAGMFFYYFLQENPVIKFSFYLNGAAAVCALIATLLFWIHVFYMGCFEL